MALELAGRVVRVAFIELVMRPLIWLLAAPRVVRRAVQSAGGPVLVIANHVTAYDGALVLYALPGRLRRRMASAMSGEMLMDLRRGRNQGNALVDLVAPAGYWLVTALFNVFPLPRLRGFRQELCACGGGYGSGLLGADFSGGNAEPGWEVAGVPGGNRPAGAGVGGAGGARGADRAWWRCAGRGDGFVRGDWRYGWVRPFRWMTGSGAQS